MNRLSLIFALIVTFSSLTGCSITSENPPPSQSGFKESFSLGPIVEANEGFLLAGSRGLSGVESGPRGPFVQSHEEMIVQIDPANISPFMGAIRNDINEAITSSGADILGYSGGIGQGPDDLTRFSYSYSEGDLYGTIQVWGLRSSGTNFQLIVLLTEGQGE